MGECLTARLHHRDWRPSVAARSPQTSDLYINAAGSVQPLGGPVWPATGRKMKTDTFDKLRLIDRIDGAHISSGAAALLAYVQRVQRAGRWHIATADALAAALKVSRRSVVRYLKELRELGLLAVWKRKAVRDGARVNLASGYRIVADALREAASDGFERRKAVIKAKLAALCGRSVKRSCANLAQQTRQEDKQMLWNMLGQAVEGRPGWETLVAALIRAGEGQTEADFRGFGRA